VLEEGGNRFRHVDVELVSPDLGHVGEGHALSGIQSSSITLGREKGRGRRGEREGERGREGGRKREREKMMNDRVSLNIIIHHQYSNISCLPLFSMEYGKSGMGL
jgi:hypothetical protein